MLLEDRNRFAINPLDKKNQQKIWFWLILSLTVAALCAIPGLQEAFSSGYVIQDDARQHVFWLQRSLDPQLFPNDLIADYYKSVQPVGYKMFYQLFASVGIDPLVLSKLLPIVLGLVTTAYAFSLCMEILPVPAAGFIATLLFNYMLWSGATLVTATSRAFGWPLFLAILYYLVRDRCYLV
jgi:hypothetical protein